MAHRGYLSELTHVGAGLLQGRQEEPLANVGCNRRDGRCRKWLSGIQLLLPSAALRTLIIGSATHEALLKVQKLQGKSSTRPGPRLLPQKLVLIRHHLSLSETEIKDSLDLSQTTRLSDYENGKRKVPLTIAFDYSRLGQVPMASLADDQISLKAFRKQLGTFDHNGIEITDSQAIEPASRELTTASNYTVQPPVNLGGHNQQIRATIKGTPWVAGSVEITALIAGKAFLSNLRVHRQHRRRGVATKLITAAIKTARGQGFIAVSLEARPSDNAISLQALVGMYGRQGFKEVGKTPRGNPLMERKL